MNGIKNDDNKLPYSVVLTKQFPLAIKSIIARSEYGHKKYIDSDKDYMNFKRIPNAEERYFNAMGRHFFNDGEKDETEIDHLTALAWNTLALLQLKLEKK